MSHFLIGVSFQPVLSSSAIYAGLVILDLGATFVLAVVESLTLEAQILLLVGRHCLCFSVFHLFHCSTPPFV
jgi:hypothetical protein